MFTFPVTVRNLLVILSFLGLGLPLRAQLNFDFYHVDTTLLRPSAKLPHLYFKQKHKELVHHSHEDLSYVIYMMQKYPQMELRLRCDGKLKRFDWRQRRFNRRRMRHLVKLLKRAGIAKSRLVTITEQPWNYRSAREPAPHELEYRRIICEPMWPATSE
jgi:hypothetical protein